MLHAPYPTRSFHDLKLFLRLFFTPGSLFSLLFFLGVEGSGSWVLISRLVLRELRRILRNRLNVVRLIFQRLELLNTLIISVILPQILPLRTLLFFRLLFLGCARMFLMQHFLNLFIFFKVHRLLKREILLHEHQDLEKAHHLILIDLAIAIHINQLKYFVDLLLLHFYFRIRHLLQVFLYLLLVNGAVVVRVE